MANYNVNMKQWNGTSFDNVLPLAYLAKDASKLEGNSLSELKTWVRENNLLLFTGQYIGTGVMSPTYISITFPFEPLILFMPTGRISSGGNLFGSTVLINVEQLSTSSTSATKVSVGGAELYVYRSLDSKTIYFTGTTNLNVRGLYYYFAAIGGYDMGGAD